MLNGASADVEHLCRFGLGRDINCANLRTSRFVFFWSVRCKLRNVRRNHSPLALIQVPPVQVQRNDKPHRVGALVKPKRRHNPRLGTGHVPVSPVKYFTFVEPDYHFFKN